MARFCAVLLMALFSFSLISPALQVADNQNVPACCRRSGKHHCSMGSGDHSSGLKASGKCPLFPSGSSVPVQGSFGFLLAKRPVTRPPGVPAPAIVAQAEAGYRISLSRSRTERGPPSLPV